MIAETLFLKFAFVVLGSNLGPSALLSVPVLQLKVSKYRPGTLGEYIEENGQDRVQI